MAEDLDSLLADLELDTAPAAPAAKAGRAPKTSEPSELDDLLADVLSTEPPKAARGAVPQTRQSAVPAQPSLQRGKSQTANPTGSQERCQTVYLGHAERGRSSGFKQLCCDRLKCTACDFAVIDFIDYAWKETSDYLFFRNNFPVDRLRPDTRKLEAGLVSQPGTVAQCCQCAFRSTAEVTALKDTGAPVPSWRCGGH